MESDDFEMKKQENRWKHDTADRRAAGRKSDVSRRLKSGDRSADCSSTEYNRSNDSSRKKRNSAAASGNGEYTRKPGNFKSSAYHKNHTNASNGKSGGADEKKRRNFCSNADRCGGCQYAGIAYEEQLELKQKLERKLLNEFGPVLPIMGADHPDHYRNKVSAALGFRRDGRVISGIYAEHSHRIIPVDSCRLEDKRADAIIVDTRKLLESFRIRIYNEDTGYGLMRHILVRVGQKTGQVLVVLAAASPVMPSKNNFVKALRRQHPEITSIVLNVNDRSDSMVLGSRDIVLYGPGYIEDELCGCTFRISAQSFYQVNAAQTRKLYETAMRFAGLDGTQRVIDAYSGIGTIGLIASGKAAQVICVELNPEAVKDAAANARRNRAENIAFYEADAGEFLTEMAEDGEQADVLFMDPPRAGSSREFLESVCTMKPARVVYISCEPTTLARDLKYLTQHGYRCEKIQPVDMFPHTEHVETVCLLSRKDK